MLGWEGGKAIPAGILLHLEHSGQDWKDGEKIVFSPLHESILRAILQWRDTNDTAALTAATKYIPLGFLFPAPSSGAADE